MRRTILHMLMVTVMLTWSSMGKGPDKSKVIRGLQKTADPRSWSKKALQGFSIKLWLNNQAAMGILAYGGDASELPPGDCSTGIGCEYPAGTTSCVEHLYGAGPCIGGKINGTRFVSETYNSEDAREEFVPPLKDTLRQKIWRTIAGDVTWDYNFDPPRMLEKAVNRRDCDDDGDSRVDEDELDGVDNDGDWNALTDDVGADGLPDQLELSCDGKAYDAATNPDPAGDNYDPTKRDKCHPDPNTGGLPAKNDKNKYTEKNGLPDHGEPHVDEDFAALSDNDLYLSVADTVDNSTVAPSGHIRMGIQVIQKSYAWRGSFAEGLLPMDYYFINVGKNTITDVYIGFIADFDVGPVDINSYWTHDYTCYMPDLYTAYVHNAQDRGSTPLGLTVLGTPKPLDQLRFIYQPFSAGDFSTRDSIVYGWLNGENFPSDIGTCGSPELPSDVRLFYSFGPFDSLKKGDTLKISMAVVGAEGVESGVHNLRDNAQQALKLFKRGYKTTARLPSPKLVAEPGFKKVTLRWYPSQAQGGGSGPATVWDDSNRIAGSFPPDHWRRINPPCDPPGTGSCAQGHACTSEGVLPGGRIHEGFRLYRAEDPNNTTPNDKNWTLLKEFDYADDSFNYNVGVDSVFVDTNLVRGKRYWYAVTSFGIPDLSFLQRPEGGVDSLLAPGVESPISENATRVDLYFSAAESAGEVLAVPNPYRVDADYTFENGGWEGRSGAWNENKRLIKFIHLPKRCRIRIFTLVGDEIAALDYDAYQQAAEEKNPQLENKGELEWNLVSESNRALASGVYIFTVDALDAGGGKTGSQIGKFVLIR